MTNIVPCVFYKKLDYNALTISLFLDWFQRWGSLRDRQRDCVWGETVFIIFILMKKNIYQYRGRNESGYWGSKNAPNSIYTHVKWMFPISFKNSFLWNLFIFKQPSWSQISEMVHDTEWSQSWFDQGHFCKNRELCLVVTVQFENTVMGKFGGYN